MPRRQADSTSDSPARVERLGFRIDEQTKELIERAAYLERRKVTDYCVTVLAAAARRTVAQHETLTLSENDRKAFFEALTNPPQPNARLRRAAAAHKRLLIDAPGE